MRASGSINVDQLRARHSERLGNEHFMKKGSKINWKTQYRLRHNWSHGLCRCGEIQISSCRESSTTLIQLQNDIIITVDSLHGLRAWSTRDFQRPLCILLPLHADQDHSSPHGLPTSLSIDSAEGDPAIMNILVGFANGSLRIYEFDRQGRSFSPIILHNTPITRIVSASSYSSPYLAAMVNAEILFLYHFPLRSCEETGVSAPRLLASLASHTAWPPLSISIRKATFAVLVSIVYAIPTYPSGWTVGLQELRLTAGGEITANRLASAINQGFASVAVPQSFSDRSLSTLIPYDNPLNSTTNLSKPNFVSYSHPYLLTSHADNTLTFYLVTSTNGHLKIGVGIRLWGHTSSVYGGHIGDHGKAITIAQGGDVRVWELEESAKFPTSKKSITASTIEGMSIGQPEVLFSSSNSLPDILDSPRMEAGSSIYSNRGWVGFDEERVVVLREGTGGTQTLIVYDFS